MPEGSELLDFAGDVGAGNLDTATSMPPAWMSGLQDPGAGNLDTATNFTPSWMSGGGSGGGGGVWDKLGSGVGKFAEGLGDEITRSPLKSFSTALGLGSTATGLVNQSRLSDQMKSNERGIKDAQARSAAAAAPAIAAGTSDVNRAQQGKLQPAMESAIADWAQKAKADVQGRYASMGLGNSSDIQSKLAEIDKMALSMRAQLLQGQEQTGGALLSTGVSASNSGAQLAQNNQKMLQDLIVSADQALGRMAGATA